MDNVKKDLERHANPVLKNEVCACPMDQPLLKLSPFFSIGEKKHLLYDVRTDCGARDIQRDGEMETELKKTVKQNSQLESMSIWQRKENRPILEKF